MIDWGKISEKLGRTNDDCQERLKILEQKQIVKKEEENEKKEEEEDKQELEPENSRRIKRGLHYLKDEWTQEEDKRLFLKFKEKGSKWAIIANDFPNRTENEIKNRFYSTLRRVATKKSREKGGVSVNSAILCKEDLLKYVDDAIEYGHNCFSKRGRKKKKLNKCINNSGNKLNVLPKISNMPSYEGHSPSIQYSPFPFTQATQGFSLSAPNTPQISYQMPHLPFNRPQINPISSLFQFGMQRLMNSPQELLNLNQLPPRLYSPRYYTNQFVGQNIYDQQFQKKQ